MRINGAKATTFEYERKESMPNDAKPQSQSRPIAGYIVLGAAVFTLVHSFALLAPIILSFLLIILISLALNPVISRLRTWTGGRKRAAAVLTLAMVFLLGMTAWGTYRPVKGAVFNLAEQWPSYWDRFQKPLIKMEQHFALSEERLQAEVVTETSQEDASVVTKSHSPPDTTDPALPEPTEERLQAEVRTETSQEDASVATEPHSPPDTTDPALSEPKNESGSVRANLMQALQGVVGSFAAIAFNAGQIIVVLLTVFFGVIFALMNPRPIVGILFLIVPERHHDKALTIAQRIGYFVPRWAGATLLGMLAVALLVFLLMWPIFGFFDALVLAMIAGVMEAIPFVGPVLSAVPALLLALSEGGMTPLWVVLAYIVIQTLEGNVLLPIILSRGVHVHPVALIFSTLLCVTVFGVLGVLVSAPLVAVVRILHEELYRKRFLPTTTDASLDNLARKSLHEKVSDDP